MTRLSIIGEIILLYVLPVLWFVLGLGQWEQRLVVFEVFVVIVIILSISRKMNFYEMEFRTDNFIKSIKLLLPGSLFL